MHHTWDDGMYDELGRLAQGNKLNNIKGTNMAYFIHPTNIPKDRVVENMRIVVDICPQKTVPKHVRLTISGDRVKYHGEVTTTIKLHLNSVVSRKFFHIYISNFYLDIPFTQPEYAHIAAKYVPQQFIDEYNLT